MSSGLSQAHSSPTYKIGLAGCGKMGSAMVRGWLSAGIASHIDILDPNGIPDELLHAKEIFFTKDEMAFAAKATDWDILVIAIKPQMMEAFCSKIKPPQHLCILSIAAGQTISNFEKAFGTLQPVIRSMPNTPAAVGKGATVAYANKHVTTAQTSMADDLLSKMGLIAWVEDETKLDAVTGLSGSGPAYVFYMIEAMAQAGIDAGLDTAMATMLARQTIIGAAALAEQDAQTSAAKLRENVTSPNGTTAAALEILMAGKFQDIVTETVARATARSKELSK